MLLLSFVTQAQTTKSTDFWVSFLVNGGEFGIDDVTLIAVGDQNSLITVENPITGWNTTVSLTSTSYANLTSATISIPFDAALSQTASMVSNRGLHVTSTDPIQLYALNRREYSCDMATVIPTVELGTEYMVQDYANPTIPELESPGAAEVLFVATADSTVLTMTLPCVTQPTTVAPGHTLTVNLMRGQTYMLVAPAPNEFSGMVVSSNNKPFALFQGNKLAAVVNGTNISGDHIFEQAVPLYCWGHNYLAVSTPGRQWGDKVRILSSADNCLVTIDGDSVCILQRGHTYDYHLPPSSAKYIVTSQPSSVTLLTASSTWEVESGDVSSVILTPLGNGVGDARFCMPATSHIGSFYINVVAVNSSVAGITLDGNNIANQFISAGGYRYARLPVSSGLHVLSGTGGLFTAYAYGNGNVESYAFPLGRSFPPRSGDTILVRDTICTGQSYDTLGVRLFNADTLDLGTSIYHRDVMVGGQLVHYIVYLTVLQSSHTDFYDTISFGDTIVFCGLSLTADGDYSVTYTAANGCDSTLTMHLTLLRDTVYLKDTVCRNMPYSANGFNLPPQRFVGIFTYLRDTIEQNLPLCYKLTLVVLPDYHTELSYNIVAGDTLLFDGTPLIAEGDYQFLYSAANGCDSTVIVHLYFESLGINADREGVCPGEQVTLTATGTHTFIWSSTPPDPSLDAQQGLDTIIVTPWTTTTYMLLDSAGAIVATVTVGAEPPPVPCVQYNHTDLDFDNPELSLTDCSEGSQFTTWTFDDGTVMTMASVTHQWNTALFFPRPDSVGVTMTTCNRYNCCSDTTLTFPLKIRSIWFPNVFTPGTDNNNLFGCYTSHEVAEYELVIFNRWGMQLWSTTDINQGWDGRRADGTACIQGAYVYRYYLRATDGTVDSGIGTVTLLR